MRRAVAHDAVLAGIWDRKSEFYAKVGYQPMSVEFAQPPVTHGYPNGWLGLALDGQAFTPLQGTSRCVSALNNPDYW